MLTKQSAARTAHQKAGRIEKRKCAALVGNRTAISLVFIS